MSYRIAGIDVHKRMLAVVIADVAVGSRTNPITGSGSATYVILLRSSFEVVFSRTRDRISSVFIVII